jgi:flagellar basal-body rod protein FlgB
MVDPLGDVTMSALHRALSGLSLRQRTIADNIANIETPGFLAGRVDFENSLRSAVATGADPSQTQSTVQRSLEPTLMNGNNVNLDQEMLTSTKTNLEYQLTVEALNAKFQRLRLSIGGGR